MLGNLKLCGWFQNDLMWTITLPWFQRNWEKTDQPLNVLRKARRSHCPAIQWIRSHHPEQNLNWKTFYLFNKSGFSCLTLCGTYKILNFTLWNLGLNYHLEIDVTLTRCPFFSFKWLYLCIQFEFPVLFIWSVGSFSVTSAQSQYFFVVLEVFKKLKYRFSEHSVLFANQLLIPWFCPTFWLIIDTIVLFSRVSQ